MDDRFANAEQDMTPDFDDGANAEQDMTPDFDDGADIEQMDYPSDYPDTTPSANVEFGEIMEPETGDVQHSNNFFLFFSTILVKLIVNSKNSK